MIDDMDAAGYHDDRDDVLNPELFVKEERCEDDAQHRDQRIVDCDLADWMIGQKRIVDGKAHCGDRDQADKDKDTFDGKYPCCLRTD